MVIGFFFLTHIFHERDWSHLVFICFLVTFLSNSPLHAILLNKENIILFFFSSFEEKNLRGLNAIHILEFPSLLPPQTIISQPCEAIQYWKTYEILNPVNIHYVIITPLFIKGSKNRAQELTKFIDIGMSVRVCTCVYVLYISKALYFQIHMHRIFSVNMAD